MKFSISPSISRSLVPFTSRLLYCQRLSFSLLTSRAFSIDPCFRLKFNQTEFTPRANSLGYHLRPSKPASAASHRSMASKSEARPKRRQSPVNAIERPSKHLKQEHGARTPGDSTPANGTVYDVANEAASVPIINTMSAPSDSPEWQAMIEGVIKSVVSIHFCQTCSFDTDLSTSSQATGFVVDADKGYILTNRHVVCSGPFWGYCVFDNHEEVWISRATLKPTDIDSAMSNLCTAILFTTLASSNSIPKPSSICLSKP